jgi:hypothetical protein
MDITATTAAAASLGVHHRPQGPPPPPKLDGTAELLGMSSDELRTAQRSGTTLSELAESKGVSKDDLVASSAKDMEANKPEGAPELSEARLTEMATNIADGVRAGGPPQGGFGPPPPPRGDRAQENLSAVAQALGTDADTLLDKLRSGEDITEWLQSLKAQTGYGDSDSTTISGVQVDTYA